VCRHRSNRVTSSSTTLFENFKRCSSCCCCTQNTHTHTHTHSDIRYHNNTCDNAHLQLKHTAAHTVLIGRAAFHVMSTLATAQSVPHELGFTASRCIDIFAFTYGPYRKRTQRRAASDRIQIICQHNSHNIHDHSHDRLFARTCAIRDGQSSLHRIPTTPHRRHLRICVRQPSSAV